MSSSTHGTSGNGLSSSSKHASKSKSSKSKLPLSKLNAGTHLSSEALLAASAHASHELERILRGEHAARARSRSRSRSQTKSPHQTHKAALLEGTQDEDPFLVHTVHSNASTIKTEKEREREKRRKHRVPSSSSLKHRHVAVDTSTAASETTSIVTSDKEYKTHSRKHRHGHRSRSRSRSLERTHDRDGRYVSVSSSSYLRHPHSSSHSSHHVHHSSHRHPSSSSRHRSRSRSHSRNRYPDGYAPPLQAVGGGPDVELHRRFIDPFEYDEYLHHQRQHRGVESPPMSPSRLDARAAYEHDMQSRRRAHEEMEFRRRRLEELEHLLETQGVLTPEEQEELEYLRATMDQVQDELLASSKTNNQDSRRMYETYPRKDYSMQPPPEDQPSFRLDRDPAEEDELKLEDPLSTMALGDISNDPILSCPLCKVPYDAPGDESVSGDAGKVPRYLFCGHTFCTRCLEAEMQKHEDIRLGLEPNATGTGNASAASTATATITSPQNHTRLTLNQSAPIPLTQKFGVTMSLPCPTGQCQDTPVNEQGVLSLPINHAYLNVHKFIRTRRAAGFGLKDTGIGKGNLKSEEEKVAELNHELEQDARRIVPTMYQTSLPCQQCLVQLSTLYCQACNIRFCAACSASVHVGKALSEHVKKGLVVTLNVARARGWLFGSTGKNVSGITSGTLCPSHQEQALTLYCRTCQVPVCRDCITPLFKGKHLPPGHDVDLLSTVLQSTYSELKSGTQVVETTLERLQRTSQLVGKQLTHVQTKYQDVRTELKDAFSLIRNSILKALQDRESRLEQDLLHKVKHHEGRIQAQRAEVAKLLVLAKAAQEEGVRVLNSSVDDQEQAANDVYAIKALLDVRAALNAGTAANLPGLLEKASGGSVNNSTGDILLRVKPRDLIRLVEQQISKAGGVIASIPSEPLFVSFTAQGTSLILSWTPAAAPVEGEVLEYILEVAELLSRHWKTHVRQLQPSLFPNPPSTTEEEDNDEAEKWEGHGPLLESSRAAVNFLALQAGAVALGGSELIWKQVAGGGAAWIGNFTTLYSGEVCTVKHDNLNIQAAYVYRLSVKNDLGCSGYTYSMPCTLPAMHLSYQSDMDACGLITYLGSQGGHAPWSNPSVAGAAGGLIEVTASSVQLGETQSLTSRQAATFQTLNRHLSWIKLDLGKAQPFRLLVTHYTLANCGRGVGVRRALRNWALQGSQNGVDWVTLREHNKDSRLEAIPLATATWPVTPPTPEPYRYFRILQTDVNHANDHHLALGQIELYGWVVRD